MVPVARSDSCAQHQCFKDYLQLLVFTGCEFTVNTDKCSTLCAPRGVGLHRYREGLHNSLADTVSAQTHQRLN
jgi:hypothetical protein